MTAAALDVALGGALAGHTYPAHGMGGMDGMETVGGLGPPWVQLVLPAVALTAYGYGVLRLAVRGDRWPLARTGWYGAGVLALLIAVRQPPLGIGDFSSHVLQHLLLAMLAPLCLALAAPVTLALRTLRPAGRRLVLALLHSRVARLATLAPVVLALDVGGMYLYYLTPLFSQAHEHEWLHVLVHAHMFGAGCLLSWYVVGRDPMPARPSTRRRLVVLFVAAASHDLLAKLMYAHALPADGGSAESVRAGAQLMFYGGDLIEVLLAVALMTQWYARGGRQLRHENRRAATAGYAAARRTDIAAQRSVSASAAP